MKGYNNGENPFVAAQRFLNENELPQSYLSQISDWILQQTGNKSQPTLDMSNVTSNSTLNMQQNNQNNQNNHNLHNLQSKIIQKSQFIDKIINYTIFDEISNNFHTKVILKINEFNNLIDNKLLKLTENEINNDLNSLIKILCNISYYHSTKIINNHLLIFNKLLLWNNNQLFICFDILRLLILHPEGNEILINNNILLQNILQKILLIFNNSNNNNINNNNLENEIPNALLLTIIRFIVNLFRFDNSRNKLLLNNNNNNNNNNFINELLLLLNNNYINYNNKLIKYGINSLIINISVFYNNNNINNNNNSLFNNNLLLLIQTILQKEREFNEILVNIVLSLGTLINNNNELQSFVYSMNFNEILLEILEIFKTNNNNNNNNNNNINTIRNIELILQMIQP